MAHTISNLNCSELISLELGLLNSSKTLVGLIPVYTSASVTKTSLVLYFMKKTLHNPDGSNDLVTVVTLCKYDVNKTLVLSVLKKIMDKYFEFRLDILAALEPGANATNPEQLAKAKAGEFKLYMTQIIRFEEMQYSSNQQMYNYGSIDDQSNDASRNGSDIITPNQLVAANEEVDEVRNLMLDNINKLLSRGDKVNSLVDQTDRLTSSAQVFQKSAATIKRKIWWTNVKFITLLVGTLLILVYLFVGFECGYPFMLKCFH